MKENRKTNNLTVTLESIKKKHWLRGQTFVVQSVSQLGLPAHGTVAMRTLSEDEGED